jgi:hypothetical protein
VLGVDRAHAAAGDRLAAGVGDVEARHVGGTRVHPGLRLVLVVAVPDLGLLRRTQPGGIRVIPPDLADVEREGHAVIRSTSSR